MFTRRAIVAAPLAATATTLLPASQAQAAPALIRYDVASPEGKAMLRTYARGVKAMKALPATNPRSWEWQWYIHAGPKTKAALIQSVFGHQTGPARNLAQATWWTCQAHIQPPENEAYFLAWHRLYLSRFESIIRTLTATPGFTLPYWDYTEPNRASLPDEFQDRFKSDPDFGVLHVADRNTDDGQQFANVNAGEPINKYFQGRESFLNLADMQAPAYGGSTGFNATLDGNLHGSIHVFVGAATDMGDIPTAAKDPIFWLHHCNIDRIWAGWAKAGGRNPNYPQWLAKSFTFVDGQGRASTAAVRTIADYTKLDYGYDKLPAPPKPLRPPLVAARAPHMAMRATPMVMTAAAAPPVLAQATGPVTLGATPKEVTVPSKPAAVVPPAAETMKHMSVRPGQPPLVGAPAPTGEPQRLVLSLNSVQAHAAPGILYRVYLDLPAGASPEVAKDHFVGLLNFFDKVMPAQAGGGAMAMGKTVSFDITDLASRIRGAGETDQDFKVTLVPTGAPKEASAPVIAGGVAIKRE